MGSWGLAHTCQIAHMSWWLLAREWIPDTSTLLMAPPVCEMMRSCFLLHQYHSAPIQHLSNAMLLPLYLDCQTCLAPLPQVTLVQLTRQLLVPRAASPTTPATVVCHETVSPFARPSEG
jgi:hypothetical protein